MGLTTSPLHSSRVHPSLPALACGRRPLLFHRSDRALAAPSRKGAVHVAFIRLVAALIGFVFGFFLGASLLQVTQVTPVSNQVLVVLLLAAACAILGWLGAPYVTVLPAGIIVARIRAAQAGDLIGGAFGAAVGLILALFLAFPLSFLPGEVGRYAPLVTALVLGLVGATAGAVKRNELSAFAQGVRGVRRDRADARVLLDTSVIIDGRVRS